MAAGTAYAGSPAFSPVRAVAPTGADRAALIQAYVFARGLPARTVVGIRPGSLHLGSLHVSGTDWAIATFTPSRAAGARAQVGLQDSASTGVFTRIAGQPWRLRAVGGCGQGLPSPVRSAWEPSVPASCDTTASAPRQAALRAMSAAGRPHTVAQSIADIALSQVGVSANPPATNFNGVDCDPYTTLVGTPPGFALFPNTNGCGRDTAFSVQNENETWCSDFAKWVWQKAGVTVDMNTINAGANSFYAWGQDQGEVLKADAGSPAVGDAVVFYPPGPITTGKSADHVGIVSSVNRDGTVNLVNGDFPATTNMPNIHVEYDTNVSLTPWASAEWNKGEQWFLVAPPTSPQHPVPSATITGPALAVTGTSVSFRAHATESGGSVTRYLWAFGDGATAIGPDANHVFASAEPQTVTMTATSSFGTVTTRTLDLDVIATSSATVSTPSNAVWNTTIPVDQLLFLPTATGGLAAESWNGASWLKKALPGRTGSGSGLTALGYPDASDVLEPHVFFRSAAGSLAETYRGGGAWATHTLAGRPAPGSAIVARTAAACSAGGRSAPGGPEIFYFNQARRLTQSYECGTTWPTKTLPGPSATSLGSLALADTAGERHGAATHVFYIDGHGKLIVTSSVGLGPRGVGWRSTPIRPAIAVSAGTGLAAISTGPDGDEQRVFFIGRDGKLAAATSGPSGGAWTVGELPGTPARATSLVAANYLLPSGALGEDVFYLTPAGRAAATAWAGKTQHATTLPGGATAILGAGSYPVASQPQRLFLADGTKITVDASRIAGGPWTASALPGAAATFLDTVLLYAATPDDHADALVAAAAAALPAAQVTQSFSTAWADTLSGDYLVIAVGQAATDALGNNACGWINPSDAIGWTPFNSVAGPLDTLPGPNNYENAAATISSQSRQRATDLAYYATHGHLPPGAPLPAAATIEAVCSGQPSREKKGTESQAGQRGAGGRRDRGSGHALRPYDCYNECSTVVSVSSTVAGGN